MLKKCWLNAREAKWNEWVFEEKNVLTTFETFFFFYSASWLMWWCFVVVIVQARITVNALFVQWTCFFFLFMRTRARVPNVPSPKPDSYDSVTFVLLESANLVGLAVWNEPGKLLATLVRVAPSFVIFFSSPIWDSALRFHSLHQDRHIRGCARTHVK